MNCLNGRIKVRFDKDHRRVFKLGDLELIRPDEWASRDDEGQIKTDDYGNTKYEENLNYLETKPQICTVIAGNSKYPYQPGDRLFCHYMAYETAANGDLVTKEGFIIAEYVFCALMPDGTYKMAKDVYFGTQIYDLEEKTSGGIYIPDMARKPNLTQAKLTHLPDNSPFEPGEVVLTIDQYNYPCEIDGKTYIMLRENEIVGRLIKEDAHSPCP